MRGTTRSRTAKRRVRHVEGKRERRIRDSLAVEEPMEIRLVFPSLPEPVPVAVTMRTPGNDFELAAGFLFTEGILTEKDAIHTITYCRDPEVDGDQQYNIVNVNLRSGFTPDLKRLQRNFYTSSSCGVCGKASLEAIRVRGVEPVKGDFTLPGSVISRFGHALRREQAVFEKTGGLHAAGWFDRTGGLVALREDVGRHNAVDKLLGHAFLTGKTPLSQGVLMVSGRTSFEIMQKAAVAGVPVVTAVSAPSSLACEVAEEFGMTLIGFAREERFNIYTGGSRILPQD
ncbi:FdhD protein [Melghirimyces profundicolus]|uniref:Sulfur carrier protein FdhD n=1 Tax=Melghirimyces profundicolus TaxID=1242148 RepID=A0A2T6BS62_9BACL|nr:formate dehydrogenase accessory sulfurtransferase FdhD [Melghirimyces profundicolus]PTX58879.1 FdhD protein [Melghirimyces profundicolus]